MTNLTSSSWHWCWSGIIVPFINKSKNLQRCQANLDKSLGKYTHINEYRKCFLLYLNDVRELIKDFSQSNSWISVVSTDLGRLNLTQQEKHYPLKCPRDSDLTTFFMRVHTSSGCGWIQCSTAQNLSLHGLKNYDQFCCKTSVIWARKHGWNFHLCKNALINYVFW